ncbi:class II aldolase/adducin family protein [uncultured Desulfovibrio sp.]|uniref:class II aldolase/adducin family protein n=1 Tax=uncultured Desulfovibrio sp. TaxID=167968 RepID=UPI002604C072|nr:class II aldolase/adducin family protein [uncultured Desulfovibrio sp.]
MPDATRIPEHAAAWRDIARCCRDAWHSGLLRGFNGNASCRLSDGNVLITRSGCAKGRLREEDACLQTPDGSVLRGGPASSEGRMHLAVYAAAPQTLAVLHTHPPRLLALSLRLGAEDPEGWRDAFLSLPLFEARTWKQRLAFAPALPPGTPELAEAVARAAQTAPAVWMESHGLCCHGGDLAFCLGLSEHLEHLAAVQLECMGARERASRAC